MNSFRTFALITTYLISFGAYSQWDDRQCTEAFHSAQASTTCKLLTSNAMNDEAKCELVAECSYRLAREENLNVNVISIPMDDISSLTNHHGKLVINP